MATHDVRADACSTSRSARTSRCCASRAATPCATWCVDSGGYDRDGNDITEGGNPQTGPFFVEGAEPGDTLAVRLDRHRAEPHARPERPGRRAERRRSRGCAAELPRGHGRGLVDARPRAADRAARRPAAGLESLGELPLDPMLGCFGVAPARGQAISTATSGEHGGNMDYRGFRAGVTVYFPVFVEGALVLPRRRPRAAGRRRDRRHRHRGLVDVEFTVEVLKGKRDRLAARARTTSSAGGRQRAAARPGAAARDDRADAPARARTTGSTRARARRSSASASATSRQRLRPRVHRRREGREGVAAVSRSDPAAAQLSTYAFPTSCGSTSCSSAAPVDADVDAIAPAFRDPGDRRRGGPAAVGRRDAAHGDARAAAGDDGARADVAVRDRRHGDGASCSAA